MPQITINVTDAELELLTAQLKDGNSMMYMGATEPTLTFQAELDGYTQQRLQQARELAKRKITAKLTDPELVAKMTE